MRRWIIDIETEISGVVGNAILQVVPAPAIGSKAMSFTGAGPRDDQVTGHVFRHEGWMTLVDIPIFRGLSQPTSQNQMSGAIAIFAESEQEELIRSDPAIPFLFRLELRRR